MIAIHAALYVFRSSASKGEAGLYTHRYIAYSCWLIFPTLMASLAFVNPNAAYLASGNFCTLPVRPFWYRLALSWIPRYLIISTIIILYISIYAFVHYKFKDFKQESGPSHKTLTASTTYPRNSKVRGTHQETELVSMHSKRGSNAASLAKHGLLPSPADQVAKMSDSYFVPHDQSHRQSTDGPTWERYTFGSSQPVTPLPQTEYITACDLASRPRPDEHLDGTGNTNVDRHRHFSLATTSSRTSYNMVQALRDSRITSMAPTLTDPITPAATLDTRTNSVAPGVNFFDAFSPISLAVRGGETGAAPLDLARRHRDIKRKLRLLFIYPLLYMLMWIVPFVSHCLQYSDSYSRSPNYYLYVTVVAFLALQGAVDSLMFTTRERPWQHLNKSKYWVWRLERGETKVKGQSRIGNETSEQAAEADRARNRRGDEEEALRNGSRPALANRPGLTRDRSWWEVEGRMRKDSVMLGTDQTNMDQAGERRDLHEDVIREEDISPMEANSGAPKKNSISVPE